MLRLANYSLIFSFNVRETFKTNEGVWRETTESSPTPQFSTSGAVVTVAQWLVRATDDRVVTASNPVRLPHIACVFLRHNKPSVPSIIIYGVYDGGRKHCSYKYRFS